MSSAIYLPETANHWWTRVMCDACAATLRQIRRNAENALPSIRGQYQKLKASRSMKPFTHQTLFFCELNAVYISLLIFIHYLYIFHYPHKCFDFFTNFKLTCTLEDPDRYLRWKRRFYLTSSLSNSAGYNSFSLRTVMPRVPLWPSISRRRRG